jgi:chemotaxis protein MotA
MLAIAGIVVVIAAVVGGYLMEHGKLLVLLQPAELVIIGGAAIGTVLTANPPAVLKELVGGLTGVIKGSKYTKAYYLETLKMFYELFQTARKGGISALEADFEDPFKSQLFAKYPNVVKDHHAILFVCDTLRMVSTGGSTPFDLDQMMESDIEIHHKLKHQPVAALSTMADSLPGLGIVAAVLGVVITMGALGGPPEEIGHKVAAALVGTFLGILMCYGMFGPIAANMSSMNDDEGYYYQFLRAALTAFTKGATPIVVVEFGRRMVPSRVRPSFQEMETTCKGGAAPKAEAA